MSSLVSISRQHTTSIVVTLAVIVLYTSFVIPLNTINERLQLETKQLQSDLIEAKSLLGGASEVPRNEYFISSKGLVFAETLKKSLAKFRIKGGEVSVTDGAVFTVTASLNVEKMETLNIWLSYLRTQYALRPIEVTVTLVRSSRDGTEKNPLEASTDLFKVLLHLQGLRV